MKTLLLTDIPPCSNFTAGIVTAQICRTMKSEDLVVFAIVNPELNPEIYPDLAHLKICQVKKPKENRKPLIFGRDLGSFGAFLNEFRLRLGVRNQLVKEAVQFARENDVKQVWAILQGQTMIRVSLPVARKLRVPLRTQIWDPFSWWIRGFQIDPINAWLDKKILRKTLSGSETFAAPSQAMATSVRKEFGVPSIPLIASLEAAKLRNTATELRDPQTITIGLAGQIYAKDAWSSLCAALDSVDWVVLGRNAKLKVIGPNVSPVTIPEGKIEYTGWIPQEKVFDILHDDCDILYCPYPFENEMREVAEFSFPGKIVTYFASGRPVFFHGPKYSGPSDYIKSNHAGIICDSREPQEIVATLERLIRSPALYRDLARSGSRCFKRDFTTRKLAELSNTFFNTLWFRLSFSANLKLRLLHKFNNNGFFINLRDKIVSKEFFDQSFYLENNLDVRSYKGTPWRHYIMHGMREGRDPSPFFSTATYIELNPDVAGSGMNAFVHYAMHGRKEQRSAIKVAKVSDNPALDFSDALIRAVLSAAKLEKRSLTDQIAYFDQIKLIRQLVDSVEKWYLEQSDQNTKAQIELS